MYLKFFSSSSQFCRFFKVWKRFVLKLHNIANLNLPAANWSVWNAKYRYRFSSYTILIFNLWHTFVNNGYIIYIFRYLFNIKTLTSSFQVRLREFLEFLDQPLSLWTGILRFEWNDILYPEYIVPWTTEVNQGYINLTFIDISCCWSSWKQLLT